MKIFVELMAIIKRPNNVPRTFEREMDKPLTIKELLMNLDFTLDEIRMMQCFITTSTKSKSVRVERNYTLRNGDNLFVTLPIGGG